MSSKDSKEPKPAASASASSSASAAEDHVRAPKRKRHDLDAEVDDDDARDPKRKRDEGKQEEAHQKKKTKAPRAAPREVLVCGATHYWKEKKGDDKVYPLPTDLPWEYFPEHVDVVSASDIYNRLFERLNADEEANGRTPMKVMGNDVIQPRTVLFFDKDPESTGYSYSGITLQSSGWPKELETLRLSGLEKTGQDTNCAVVNLYRDSKDCVHWHQDFTSKKKPYETGILSFTFLDLDTEAEELKTRAFDVRLKITPSKKDKLADHPHAKKVFRYRAGHGSLFHMKTGMQAEYEHSVPRVTSSVLPRINVTLRSKA